MLQDKKGAIFLIEDFLSEQAVELVKQLGAELKINTTILEELPPSVTAFSIDKAIQEDKAKIEKRKSSIEANKAELAKITHSYDEQMNISTELQEGLVKLRAEVTDREGNLNSKKLEVQKAKAENEQLSAKIGQLENDMARLTKARESKFEFIKVKKGKFTRLKEEVEGLRFNLGKEKLIDIDALDMKTGEVCQIKSEFENALLEEGRENAKQKLKGVLSMAPTRVVSQDLLNDVMNYCFKHLEYFNDIPLIAKLESDLKSTEEDLENNSNQKSTLQGMLREGVETVEVLAKEIDDLEKPLVMQKAELAKQDAVACKVEKAIGSTLKQKNELVEAISNEEILLKNEEAILARLENALLETQAQVKRRERIALELNGVSESFAESTEFKPEKAKKSIQVVFVKDKNQIQIIKEEYGKDFYIETVVPEKKGQAAEVEALSVSKRFADQQPLNMGEKAQDAKPEVTKVTQLQRLLGYGLLLAEKLDDKEKAAFGEKANTVLASLNKHLNVGYRLFMCQCPLLRNNSVPFYYLAPLGTTSMAGDSIYNLKSDARGVTFKKMDDMVIFPGGEDNVSKMFEWKSSKNGWTRFIGNASSGFAIHA